MGRTATKSVTVTLSYIEVAITDRLAFCCPGCPGSLELNQPDANQPDQLLGVCPKCGQWQRIEINAQRTKAMMIRLPKVKERASKGMAHAIVNENTHTHR